MIGTNGNAYSARIERRHSILDGFKDTNLIAGAQNRVPVAPVENPVLTVVPGFVGYPPELSYPEPARTTEPAVVVNERGKTRIVYFPGDVERTMWHSGHTDLSRLLQNSIRWVAGADAPVTVEGTGLIETFAWETEGGFAVHVLNYTNPAAQRGWLREFYPIGVRAAGADEAAGGEQGDPRRACCARRWTCLSASRRGRSRSRFRRLSTTRLRLCTRSDRQRPEQT